MQHSSFDRVQRGERLFIQVAAQIEKLILASAIKTGERLPPERELCQQFNVSRTVIREAVRILEAKGLVTSQSGSGSYARALEARDVSLSLGNYFTTQSHSVSHDDLMEVRRLLEVRIAALAAKRATRESMVQLEDLLNKMESTLDDPSAFAQSDLEFHVALARATGNEFFALLLDPFMDALFKARRLASALEGVPEEAMDFHRTIFERVKSGNSEGAAQAMSLHLEQAGRVTKKALANRHSSATNKVVGSKQRQ